MASVNPTVNLNFSESFLKRLACIIRGHDWEDQLIPGWTRPDGSIPLTPTPVCNRCGKFKNYPITWKEYWKKPGYLVDLNDY
jgi:hypothetical protein